MSWRSTRQPSANAAHRPVIAIRCPRCRARFHRSGDRIPLYAVFPCHSCGARLMRQQSLVVAVGGPPAESAEVVERAV